MQFTEPLQLTETSEIKVVMRMSDMIGCCRISITASESPTAPNVAHDATLAMQHDQAERNQLQNSAIFTAWRLQNPQFNQANKEIDELLRGYPKARTSVMHLRDVRVLNSVPRIDSTEAIGINLRGSGSPRPFISPPHGIRC